ncbi:HtaA domain-containing protein [Glycomyces sp. A-F 0318]|uniref:HtaA domain-containing protein n=1 Tax=Glycomyces amatae TaxID=2881355 RepID=UPI001E48F00B|nr:HtaA domain-containing protein [Glycomyces amatae]MCD0442942.1 HtaA domain-containing protein [Glycomyces amatae]
MSQATARVSGALVAAAALAASLLLWAAPAGAEELSGGRLGWGVKESFRSYITGPIAQGEVQTGDGASTADGSYRFHSATGSYEDGTAVIDYQGWVYFWGHGGELDVTFANPSVEYSGDSGTLYVYVNGTRTDMASLSGASLSASGRTVSVSGASATLTSSGAEAFAGYYEAGQALDPVSFSADVVAAEPEETREASEPEPTGAGGDGAVSGAILDWGVRASWREYVSGGIADGGWTAAEGAADGGAVFRFTEGAGTAAAGDYTLAYEGTVRFTGTDVDLALTDPAVAAEDGAGVLSAEVGGTRVDLVTFEAELVEAGGVLLAEAVPTALTEAAAPVFGGFYQAGDPMDPLTIAVPLTAGAELPALPDLGSEPQEPSSSAAAEEVDAVEAAESDANPLAWVVPAALALVLGVAAAVVALTRRAERRKQTGGAGAPAAGPVPEPGSAEDTPEENGEGAHGAGPAGPPDGGPEADKEQQHP